MKGTEMKSKMKGKNVFRQNSRPLLKLPQDLGQDTKLPFLFG